MSRSQEPEIAEIRGILAALGDPWQAGQTRLSHLSDRARQVRLGVPAPRSGEIVARADVAAAAVAATGRPVVAATAPAGTLPASFDLRDVSGRDFVTQVRDQGDRGSSASFGVIAVLEATAAYTRGVPGLNLDLSEAHLRARAGKHLAGHFAVVAGEGVTFEDYFPDNGTLNPDWPNRKARAAGVTDLTGDPAAIKQHMFSYGPVAAAVLVHTDFFHYACGVYQPTATPDGGHCVALVGWDDDAGCWIAKNSWGTGWGEQGFCRIAYGSSLVETWSVLGCTAVPLRAWLPAQRALRLFATANDTNAWAYLENLGWTTLASENLALLTHARASGHPVRPFVTCDGQIDQLIV
ncbi:C1 family peptidase [Actinocrispum wychmicini]|uniref:Papain like protease n=1 Tax=Actinocrispum wychmicini TaxID=1213861 RepID=A0A4R2JEJ1_9PSEU|nr:C1 family peptidase [Actinocrispum wychmicini]TCO58091.1 papain like protease [Actinocrispum wychmicini]